MRIDPLRETAQMILVHIQLAMGNRSAAVDVFERYRMLLHAAVGIAPTTRFSDLVAAGPH